MLHLPEAVPKGLYLDILNQYDLKQNSLAILKKAFQVTITYHLKKAFFSHEEEDRFGFVKGSAKVLSKI